MKTLVRQETDSGAPTSQVVYRTRLASCAADLRAAQSLRFMVFNLELREGLAQSFARCADVDPFDEVCDHLLIEDEQTGELVGTYRMQTGLRAASHHGYYSEREFDFTPYEGLRARMMELGRACIAQGHRNYVALCTLWRGIFAYAQAHRQRYLIGCSSLTSQSASMAAAVYQKLTPYLVEPELRTQPHPRFVCLLPQDFATETPKVPKLLSAYLALGAQICAPPAIDREFKTIDFLTMLDLWPRSAQSAQRLTRFGVIVGG